MARPTIFTERLAAKICELAEQGKTDKQIAEITGIAERTLNYWKTEKPEFLHRLRESKQLANELVEASLFRKAIGYKHKAQKVCTYEGESWIEEYEEQVPPDTQAAVFWLKNRDPENWSDKVQTEISGEIKTVHDISKQFMEAMKNRERNNN